MADKKALINRGLLEIQFGTAVQELSDYCAGENPGVRKVTRLLSSLKAAWSDLMNAHVSYCTAAGRDLSATQSQEYLKEQRTIFFNAKAVGEAIVDSKEEQEEAAEDKGHTFKREIVYLQFQIDEDIKSLTEVLGSASLTPEGHKAASDMLKELENKLSNDYLALYGKIGEEFSLEEAKSQRESAEQYLDTKRPLFGQLKTKWMMARVPTVSRQESVPGGIVEAARVEGRSVKMKIKTAPIPVPKWDGRTRSFPRFKKLWTENIVPYYEESALHIMLVEALPEKVLDEVSSLASSYQEIWDHVEEKAGNSEVVARDIMGELLSISYKKYGEKFIPRFLVTLEDSEALLTSIGQQAWMTAPRSIADLEELLPPSERKEWAKKIKGTTGIERFEKFKQFLRDRKEELEALETIGNRGNSQFSQRGVPVCTYCHKRGHSEMVGDVVTCWSKQSDMAKGETSSRKDYRNGCKICGDTDHWKDECPEKGTGKDKFADSQIKSKNGQNKNKRGQKSDFGVNSNQLRKADCNRCKYASKNQSSCIGCGKSANLDHCLLHCSSYSCLGVEDRVKLVKSSNGCAVCLSASHVAASCNYRDKANWVCGLDGCSSHHHPTLHGSKDTYIKIHTIQFDEDRFEDITD